MYTIYADEYGFIATQVIFIASLNIPTSVLYVIEIFKT